MDTKKMMVGPAVAEVEREAQQQARSASRWWWLETQAGLEVKLHRRVEVVGAVDSTGDGIWAGSGSRGGSHSVP
ncbi:hypothetical protein J6590_040330 [Homalodisca vitripennis]|nr:hypothetical protein J6590_040330 [Homalodisca vitripennis]